MEQPSVKNIETEVRFLEIDVEKLKNRLQELGAQDLGEDLMEEVIFYDKDLTWIAEDRKRVRLRRRKDKLYLSYKNQNNKSVAAMEEVELVVDNWDRTIAFLEKLGLKLYRYQQQKRHTFELHGVTIDINTVAKVPTYVELEGASEETLQEMAKLLNLDWAKVQFKDVAALLEEHYGIPVRSLRYFTFDRVE